MRTTVEIPDSLMKRAKLAAVEEGTTLREMVTRGLEMVLDGGELGGHRLSKPPVMLSVDSPLRSMTAEEIVRIDEESEAGEMNEVYRRR